MHIRSPGFLSFKSTHTQIQRTLVQQLFVLFCCGWVANKNMSLAILVLSSIPMHWTVFITIHKFNSIQFSFSQFSHDWFSSLSFVQIVDWIWENLTLLLTFLSHKIMSRQKKALKILFLFCLVHICTPKLPHLAFSISLLTSVLSLFTTHASCINELMDQSISIHFNPIQFNSIQHISL